MAHVSAHPSHHFFKRKARVLAALSASLMLSACAQMGDEAREDLASARLAPGMVPASAPKTDLEKATAYWGEEFSKKPRDLDAALNYAANLKASGQKSQAMAVLQQASVFHNSERRLASEYGRLALDLDQLNAAKQLLEAADDPANPDWRVISGRGTVLAKQGKYKDAIPFYERALAVAPSQASTMNNLALAYTMSGEAEKAEDLLRRASEAQGNSPKVRQNLALVLGLQGKYDEAKTVASTDIAPDSAAANTDLVRRMVKLPAKQQPVPQPVVARNETKPTPAAAAVAALKPAAADVAEKPVSETAAWTVEVETDATTGGPALKPSAR